MTDLAGIIYPPEPMLCVYWCYSRDGSLLYVGSSKNVSVRMGLHRINSAWFVDAEWIVASPMLLRSTALALEREEIAMRDPEFNVIGKVNDFYRLSVKTQRARFQEDGKAA